MIKKIIAFITAAMLIVSLCSCSVSKTDAPSEAEAAAGKYTFYALRMGGSYVDVKEMEGQSVTLNADGTGALDWGEDNRGPISEWSINGEKLIIKAGVSVMEAVLNDGVLMIDISNDEYSWYTCYVNDKADTSDMKRISVDEYAAKLAGSSENKPSASE